MAAARTLVWLSFLAGEARWRVPVPQPRPVFVRPPGRLAGTSAASPALPAMLVAWLHRSGATEPTHAEVHLPGGAIQHVGADWIAPRPRLALLPPTERRTA